MSFFKKMSIFAHFHFFQKKSKKWSKKPPFDFGHFGQTGRFGRFGHFWPPKTPKLTSEHRFWGPKSRFSGSKNRKNPVFRQKTHFLPFRQNPKNRKNPVFCQKTDFSGWKSQKWQKQTKNGVFWAKTAPPNRWYTKWAPITPLQWENRIEKTWLFRNWEIISSFLGHFFRFPGLA